MQTREQCARLIYRYQGVAEACPVAADLAVPAVGLREVERNLQGLTMGIPPLRRGEVPLHLQRHTVGVPENINSLLRHVVHAVMCYSQHNVVRGD
jgi:hypothetical protein